MTSLYSCRHSGDQYRISKFDSHFNLESSYLTDLHACDCPAGHRPHCRHRDMLPKFLNREHVGDNWFLDYDRGGWVQGEVMLDQLAAPQASAIGVPALEEPSLPRKTFTIPPDHEAIRDATGKATGETRPITFTRRRI